MARSRAYYEEAIKAGRSVLAPDGKTKIARLEDIPSEAELARGDVPRLEASRDLLRRDISDKQLELQRIEASIVHALANPSAAPEPEPQLHAAKAHGHKGHDDEKGGKGK